MIYDNELDFAKGIKERKLHRAYLLYGAEAYLKELYTKMIVDMALEGNNSDFNLHRFDAARLDIDGLYGAVEAVPFMSARSCVIVSDLNIDKMPAADLDSLYAILADPPEACVIIMTAGAAEFSQKRTTKTKKLIDAADRIGAVIELSMRALSDTSKFVVAYLKKSGVSISAELARRLIELCPPDMLSIKNEMDKLISYATADRPPDKTESGACGQITARHIDEIVTATVTAKVFDLSKHLMDNDYDKSMSILRDLQYLREPPVMILSAISAGFIDLYRAKTALESSKPLDKLLKAFDYKGREFRIKNAMRAVQRHSYAFITDSLRILANADHMLKSSKIDNAVILERAITQIYHAIPKREGTAK